MALNLSSNMMIVNQSTNTFLADMSPTPAVGDVLEFLTIGAGTQISAFWVVYTTGTTPAPATSGATQPFYIVLQSNPNLCLDINSTAASNGIGLVLSAIGSPNFLGSNTWNMNYQNGTPTQIASAVATSFVLDAQFNPVAILNTINASSQSQEWTLLETQ